MIEVMKSRRWPRSVPILEADDICRENMTDGEKHCLMGWVRESFWKENAEVAGRSEYYSIQRNVEKILFSEIRKDQGRPCECSSEPGLFDGKVNDELIAFNDSRRTKKERIARIWNLAMAKLGYVKNNPMARK